ncbi:MAG: potassium channel family protein [Tepidisphaeraceae bacterium]
MRVLAALFGVALIVAILVEGFETVVQPRRVTRKYRISRVYYAAFWAIWRWVAGRMLTKSKKRAGFLGAFGPLSLLGIFATWVMGLVVGFAFLQWGLRDVILVNAGPTEISLGTYLYLSGTTFFTLGYGDVTPVTSLGRMLAVAESGLGFGFLAAILSYLPALFQSYSRREVNISLLDARAGSPPAASQLLLRAARTGSCSTLEPFLGEWERWAAEVLESQLSFPVLAYYRSQHDNQSWLAALTTVLDTCAVLMTQIRDVNTYQAQVTFAIARHAAVDLALVLRAKAPASALERLTAEQFTALRSSLEAAGVPLRDVAGGEEALRTLRANYEPFVRGIGERLLLIVPPLMTEDGVPDNWQRSAWMKPTPGIGKLPTPTPNEGHFG